MYIPCSLEFILQLLCCMQCTLSQPPALKKSLVLRSWSSFFNEWKLLVRRFPRLAPVPSKFLYQALNYIFVQNVLKHSVKLAPCYLVSIWTWEVSCASQGVLSRVPEVVLDWKMKGRGTRLEFKCSMQRVMNVQWRVIELTVLIRSADLQHKYCVEICISAIKVVSTG